MNFERYLSYFDKRDLQTLETIKDDKDTVSDWGIEETTSNSGSGLGMFMYQQPPPISSILSNYSHSRSNSFLPRRPPIRSHNSIPLDLSTVAIPPTTENFSKFINHYLRIKLIGDFWERFKYNLIISNLLDDSVMLSKNQQHSLPTQELEYKFVNQFTNDGLALIILKSYKLKFPGTGTHIVILINLLIFLLKSRLPRNKQITMFKVLLVSATKYCKLHRIYMMLQVNKTLGLQDDFLRKSYQLNKKLVSNVVNMKQQILFSVPNMEISMLLNNALDVLNFNLKATVVKLVPFLNGPVFQKYCNINQVDIAVVLQEPKVQETDVGTKINQFNMMRKLLICQLFSIDEKPSVNYFVSQLIDMVKVEIKPPNINNARRLLTLQELFVDNNQIMENFITLFDKVPPSVAQNQSSTDTHVLLRSDLDKLVDRISNLATNLTFFKKYNESTINDSNELSEKLMIFNQFDDEINNIKQLYKSSLNELMVQVDDGTINQQQEFSLKTFRTRNSGSYKADDDNDVEKRYSTDTRGLKLSLLTVFEDGSPSNPSPPPTRDSFNQQTLDILSKGDGHPRKPNRFSVNSMNSNLSGLSEIISSKVTSYDDDMMSKEELKLKLEHNFDRIYNLQKPTVKPNNKENYI